MFKTYTPAIEQKLTKYDDREHGSKLQANQVKALFGETGTINEIGKAFSLLRKLRADPIRSNLEIANEAKKVSDYAVNLQAQVDQSQNSLIDLSLGIKQREAKALNGDQSDVVNVAIAQSMRGLNVSELMSLLSDKRGINAANSMPAALTGITTEQLTNANNRYLKINHEELVNERQVVANGWQAIDSATNALKQLGTVTTELTRPLTKATPSIIF